jgi:hypothetical protein
MQITYTNASWQRVLCATSKVYIGRNNKRQPQHFNNLADSVYLSKKLP